MKMIWYGTESTVMHSGRARIVFDPAVKIFPQISVICLKAKVTYEL